MKTREVRTIGRIELADHLRALADMIESGILKAGDFTFDLADDMEYEVEICESNDEYTLSVEVEWNKLDVI